MEAKLVDALPIGPEWQYEPKWDGFRAIASRFGDAVEIMSKSGKTLARYFPELVSALAATKETNYVVDGEIILPIGDILSFDALQARLHPAQSRIYKLSRETPAQLMLFDCLARASRDLTDQALDVRRAAIEAFHAREANNILLLSPATMDPGQACRWLDETGGALDGVIAKPLNQPYLSGERAMRKVKHHRSADCVVGGFRRSKNGSQVASLLLGLYDDADLLNHVGFTSALGTQDKGRLTARLEQRVAAPGFSGRAPGGPSRWNNRHETPWHPLRPELVVEVRYDQVTGDRFRHGTALLRWRPDKAPKQCRMEQLHYKLRPSQLADIA